MRLILAFVAACLVSACATPSDTTVAGYSCPPAGLAVYGTAGSEVHFKGTEPGTGYCLSQSVRNGVATDNRFLFYYFQAGASGEGELRGAMRQLYPLRVGKAVRFTAVNGGYSDQRNGCYRNDIAVTGEDTVEVAGERREAWVMDWVRTGCSLSADLLIRKLWIDKEYNIVLRSDPRAPNATVAQRPFFVTAIKHDT